jgi:hypothetical protein
MGMKPTDPKAGFLSGIEYRSGRKIYTITDQPEPRRAGQFAESTRAAKAWPSEQEAHDARQALLEVFELQSLDRLTPFTIDISKA